MRRVFYVYHHPRDREVAQAAFVDTTAYTVIERDDVPPGRIYAMNRPIEENTVARIVLDALDVD